MSTITQQRDLVSLADASEAIARSLVHYVKDAPPDVRNWAAGFAEQLTDFDQQERMRKRLQGGVQ